MVYTSSSSSLFSRLRSSKVKYVIVFVSFVVGIFGPLFAEARESSTKDISALSHSSVHAKHTQTGIASWYGPGFHGRPMANGKPYNMRALTVAHRTLPLGTMVRIRNHSNGKEVVAKVTDRGPYIPGRIVDLSKGVADRLGIDGLERVTIQKI